MLALLLGGANRRGAGFGLVETLTSWCGTELDVTKSSLNCDAEDALLHLNMMGQKSTDALGSIVPFTTFFSLFSFMLFCSWL